MTSQLVYVDVSHPRVRAGLRLDDVNSGFPGTEMEIGEFHSRVQTSADINDSISESSDKPLSLMEAMSLVTVVRREVNPEMAQKYEEASELQKMRWRGEEREYQRMAAAGGSCESGLNAEGSNKLNFSSGIKEASRGLGLAGNLLLAVCGAFLCGWKLGEFFYDTTESPSGTDSESDLTKPDPTSWVLKLNTQENIALKALCGGGVARFLR